MGYLFFFFNFFFSFENELSRFNCELFWVLASKVNLNE